MRLTETKMKPSWLFLCLTLCGILAGCGSKNGSGGGAPTGLDNLNLSSPIRILEILPANPVIGIVGDVQFTVNAVAYDGSRRDVTSLVQWTNADGAVASHDVSSAGRYLAAAAGVSAVTATLANYQTSTDLTVSPAQLVSLQFSPPLGSLPRGVVQPVTLVGIFNDGSSHDLSDQASWASSDEAVVTVSDAPGSKGLLTVVNPGNATVTVTALGLSFSQAFVGTNAQLNGLSVQAPGASLPVGLSAQLSVIGSYSDGSSADLTLSATWDSSDATVASANFGGLAGNFLGLGAGPVTATARVDALSASASFIVIPATLLSLEVRPASAAVPAGTSQAFTAIGHLSDGGTIDLTSQVHWASDIGAASPSALVPGTFRAVSSGAAKVSASYNSLSGTADLDVNAAALVSLQILLAQSSLPSGLTLQARAEGTYTDGSVVDLTQAAAWSSSAPLLATVSNALGNKGLLTAFAPGSLTLTASLGGQQVSAAVTVSSAVLTGLSVTSAAASVAKGLTTQLTATGTYSDGATANLTSQAQWSSATPALGTVGNAAGNHGLLSSLAEGAVTANASFGGLQASKVVNVTSAQVVSVTVNPATVYVLLLSLRNLSATAIYTDGTSTDVTGGATWSSSNTGLLSVTNTGTKGQIKMLSVGSATITASFGGASGSCAVHSILF